MERWLWYTILVSAIAALVCALFLITRWCLNAYFVAEAGKGRYHYSVEKMLTTLNFPDGYVVWYNIGNYHYHCGNFEEAESDYYRAIECGIPYEKECPVKVNLALAMIEQITDEEWEAFLESDSDEMSPEARNVEKILMTARSILIEDGCAHEDDEDGHYEDAQTLKDEIDELLQDDEDDEDDSDDDQDEDQDDNDDQNNDDGGDGDQDHSSREDEIMDHIQDQKEESQQERAEEQQFYENYYGFGGDDGDSSEEGDGGSGGQSGEIW